MGIYLSNPEEYFMGHDAFKLLTDANFHEGIKEGVVLVDFYADWCGPCRMLTPVLEKVAKEVSGKATVAKIDIDASQSVTASFQVTSIPTLILFKAGKEVGRIVGLRDADAVKSFILSA
jgi:thioredoxin 1